MKVSLCTILLSAVSVSAAEELPISADFLEKHCFECHDDVSAKGDLNLLDLEFDPSDSANFEIWVRVHDLIEKGEMPPEDQPRPAVDEKNAALDRLAETLAIADLERHSDGRVVMRRLNRTQIENTLRDLMALPDLNVKDKLPEDSTAGGFNTVAEALEISSVHMDRYMQVAQQALDEAIVHHPQPEKVQRRLYFQDERRLSGPPYYPILMEEDEAIIFGRETGVFKANLTQFPAPYPGKYRVRVSARAYQTDQSMPFVVVAGQGVKRSFLTDTHLIGYYDAPVGKPEVVELTARLENEDRLRVYPPMLRKSRFPRENSDEAKRNHPDPGLAVQWVEVEGPLFDQWPPESHRRLFADLPLVAPPAPKEPEADDRKKRRKKKKRNRKPEPPAAMVIASEQPRQDVERLLTAFLPKAFRRPVAPREIDLYVTLAHSWFDQEATFEEAMRVAYTAALSSPEFLYLHERPGELDGYALASRLSYFLWNTRPDEELMRLAGEDKLQAPEILRAQVDRLLDDPRSDQFIADFVSQWLDLKEIDATTPDPTLYPEFDELLQYSMVRETEHFMRELIDENLSVRNFGDSEFAMLNGRLAEHYGIDGVVGTHFRRVNLPEKSPRGGVLTQASVLKVTANGTTTSPVLRGVWLLENILGNPASPPPANVPALEPDIRGASSIREELAKHRESESCATCHRKIDPLGFGLENFDVIGGYRDRYRALEHGDPVEADEDLLYPIEYLHGLPVEASDTLADGRSYQTVRDFKKLLAGEEALARCLTEKLLTYATGAVPTFSDRETVDGIVKRVAEKEFGLRSLIHEIVVSEAFLNK